MTPAGPPGDPALDELTAVLADGQRIGLLGPGPVHEHIEQARALAAVVRPVPRCFADLGSGAGVPGLVLAVLAWPASDAVLVESQQRRVEHLRRAVTRLGCGPRVVVYGDRAEHAARGEWRQRCDVVVARSFGPPATVAECAVGLLTDGGVLYVSERPVTTGERWPDDGLAQLGFAPAEIRTGPVVTTGEAPGHPVRVATLRRVGALSDRWPRTPGAIQKRPLWRA